MAFKIERADKTIEGWLSFIEPSIKNSKSITILGNGNGKHISAAIQKFSITEIFIVDPTPSPLQIDFIKMSVNLQYYSTMSSVTVLKRILQNAEQPIPVLCFRPCWNENSYFFEQTLINLIEFQEIKKWRGSPSEFILESLFL